MWNPLLSDNLFGNTITLDCKPYNNETMMDFIYYKFANEYNQFAFNRAHQYQYELKTFFSLNREPKAFDLDNMVEDAKAAVAKVINDEVDKFYRDAALGNKLTFKLKVGHGPQTH